MKFKVGDFVIIQRCQDCSDNPMCVSIDWCNKILGKPGKVLLTFSQHGVPWLQVGVCGERQNVKETEVQAVSPLETLAREL